jgi:hypothetical protein
MVVSRHILVLGTSVYAKGNMGRREYNFFTKSATAIWNGGIMIFGLAA